MPRLRSGLSECIVVLDKGCSGVKLGGCASAMPCVGAMDAASAVRGVG